MPADTLKLRKRLVDGAKALSLDLPDAQVDKLLAYLALLQKWNAVYNLTAVRDPAQMLTQHLLDCMAALPAFSGAKRVLDVGSGGGLPGIVLAIWAEHAEPSIQVHLIDTVQKKTAFLTQAKAELGLHKLFVHTGRVEQMRDDQGFDVITSRAFADLKDFVHWAGRLLSENGEMIALKGQAQAEELGGLPADWKIDRVQRLSVPGLAAERHLVHLRKAENQAQSKAKTSSASAAKNTARG